jgi:predicted enzyme related to lactoylglutathione lyase
MRFISYFLFFLCFVQARCHKDSTNNDVIHIDISGYVLTDNLGNRIGIVGSAGNDWKILDWSSLSSIEQSFLNFTDNIDLNNTTVCTLNDPAAFPNPCENQGSIYFYAADSVKMKLAVVTSNGNVLITHAMKMKGGQIIALNFSDNNIFPPGMNLRYYISYSAATQQNFKCAYGDVKICKPLVFPVTSCF